MITWLELKSEFNKSKTEFDRVYKCLNKKQKLLEETFENHKVNIIGQYNNLINLYISNFKILLIDHKLELENELFVLRDRLLNLFNRLKVDVFIPYSIKEFIDLEVQDPNFDETLIFEQEVENIVEIMVQTDIDLLRLSAQTINRNYSGDHIKLEAFINSIDLLDGIATADNKNALKNFILSKLEGKALEAMPANPATIEIIKNSLKEKIRPDSSKVIEGRNKALKLDNTSYQDFSKEAENLADSYRRALIAEGIPNIKSNEMATEKTVEMCRNVARSPMIKTVLASSQFDNPKSVIAKFLVEIGNEKPDGKILSFNSFRNGFNNNNNYGYRGRGNYNGNYNSYSNNFRNGNFQRSII
jgi:hypothetical protein